MPQETRRRVLRKMLTTAASASLVLLILGGLLTRLLHSSPAALGVSSGIILLIVAVAMVLGQSNGSSGGMADEDRDPMQVAVYPLAIPYLLNPAGIVVLVTASAEASSVAVFAVVVGILIVILALDVAVFRWAVQVSSHMNASRMLVTEKSFVPWGTPLRRENSGRSPAVPQLPGSPAAPGAAACRRGVRARVRLGLVAARGGVDWVCGRPLTSFLFGGLDPVEKSDAGSLTFRAAEWCFEPADQISLMPQAPADDRDR